MEGDCGAQALAQGQVHRWYILLLLLPQLPGAWASNLAVTMGSLEHLPDPFPQQIPLAPPSTYIQSPSTYRHPCCCLPGPGHHHLLPKQSPISVPAPPLMAARGILLKVSQILSLHCVELSSNSHLTQSRGQKSDKGLKCLTLSASRYLSDHISPHTHTHSAPATVDSRLFRNTPGSTPLEALRELFCRIVCSEAFRATGGLEPDWTSLQETVVKFTGIW